jgi:RNA polymerase sigma factor (sigma-70 family)
MTPSDAHKAARSQRGREPDGLDHLYAECGTRIYHLAYRMTGNREDAQDITQETFLRAYQKAAGFRGESEPSTWVYAIAKNLCLEHLRTARSTSFAALQTLLQDAANTAPPTGLDAAERRDLAGQVRDGCLTGLLRCLSSNQRTAFILHVILRLPVRDVAEVLDKSPGATRVLVHRARRNLREFLCRNCGAYDPANSCRCENLIGFSLKEGWIHAPSPEEKTLPDPRGIEAGIERVREVIELYRGLSDPTPPSDLIARIRELIRADAQGIFIGKMT